MIVKACNRGHSFKGVLAYVFDQNIETKRYGFYHAQNMSSQNRSDFAIDMITTERNAEALKREAGIPLTGNKPTQGGVYHFILSWDEGETPSDDHQKTAALEAINQLGLAEHQSVICSHTDTSKPHVHIVVNLTHPTTGKRASVQRDYKKLSNWARDYEREHGIKCHNRRDRTIERGTKPARIYDPHKIIDRLEKHHAAFTRQTIERDLYQSIPDRTKRSEIVEKVLQSDRLQMIGGKDGNAVYATPYTIEIERGMVDSAQALHERGGHKIKTETLRRTIGDFNTTLAAQTGGKARLSPEQITAMEHLTHDKDLTSLRGVAGAGKSTILNVARQSWEAEGYTVRGLALSGIAAKNLEDSGFHSETLHAMEKRSELADTIMLENAGRALSEKQAALVQSATLTHRDILVIDEAAMVGANQLSRVLAKAEQAGAKVVLVGDSEQLQSIESGAAFRTITERFGAGELLEVRRQREQWQREATQDFANGNVGAGLKAYDERGCIEQSDNRDDAKAALVRDYMEGLQHAPDKTRLALAYTRQDVKDLNADIRAQMIARGLVDIAATTTETIEKDAEGEDIKRIAAYAKGDRFMFGANDKAMNVKNGALGTIEAIQGSTFVVALDGGQKVTFDSREYKRFSHGYACTVHKSQGATIDQTHVMASRHIDRHAAYVALSRHKDSTRLYVSREEFDSTAALYGAFSKDGRKLSTLDFIDHRAKDRTEARYTRDTMSQTPPQSDPQDLAKLVTAEYHAAQDGRTFMHAMQKHGLALAPASRGGGFVVITEQGEIKKLSRLLEIKERGSDKTKAMQAKFLDIDRASLGNADDIAAYRKRDKHEGAEAKDKAEGLNMASQFEEAAPAYKPDYDSQAKTRAAPRKAAQAKKASENFNKAAPRVSPDYRAPQNKVVPNRENDNLNLARQHKQKDFYAKDTAKRAVDHERLSPQEMHKLRGGLDKTATGQRHENNKHILPDGSRRSKPEPHTLQPTQPHHGRGRGSLATAQQQPTPKLQPEQPRRKLSEQEKIARIMREQAAIRARSEAAEAYKHEKKREQIKSAIETRRSIERAEKHAKSLQTAVEKAKHKRGIVAYRYLRDQARKDLAKNQGYRATKTGKKAKAADVLRKAQAKLETQIKAFGQDINTIYANESEQTRVAALAREGFTIKRQQDPPREVTPVQAQSQAIPERTHSVRENFAEKTRTNKSEHSQNRDSFTQSQEITHEP